MTYPARERRAENRTTRRFPVSRHPPAPPVAVCPSATDRRDSARHDSRLVHADSRLVHAEPLDGAQPLHLDPRLEAVGIEAALLIGGRVVRLVGCWGWGWGWGYGWA